MKTRLMKTLLALALVLGSAFSVVACDDSTTTNPPDLSGNVRDLSGGGG